MALTGATLYERLQKSKARQSSPASEPYSQPRIEGARPGRAQRARIGEGRPAIAEVGDRPRVENRPLSRIAIVEVVNEPGVDLENLVDLVGAEQGEQGEA